MCNQPLPSTTFVVNGDRFGGNPGLIMEMNRRKCTSVISRVKEYCFEGGRSRICQGRGCSELEFESPIRVERAAPATAKSTLCICGVNSRRSTDCRAKEKTQ